MKKSKTCILIGLILVLCTPRTFAYEHSVDILHVTKFGSSVSIVLDYNLNSTLKLDSNESLAVLAVFSQDEPFLIEAAMLFFHTIEEQYLLFWTLGDPYTQAQNWILGQENDHFQIDDSLLTLNFIEFPKIGDPTIHPIVLALITTTYEISNQTIDFRPILEKFIPYLPVYYEIPSSSGPESSSEAETTETQSRESSEETSHETGVGGLTPGFVFLSTLGVFLSIPIATRLKRKK
ncbi:MAG: hypothetical protein ACFFC6_10210 [Promethearchaeota archaeon]